MHVAEPPKKQLWRREITLKILEIFDLHIYAYQYTVFVKPAKVWPPKIPGTCHINQNLNNIGPFNLCIETRNKGVERDAVARFSLSILTAFLKKNRLRKRQESHN